MSEELDLDALEKIAREATQGPWEAEADRFGDWRIASVENIGIGGPDIRLWEDDATFIATFDPPTCLAMLAELRRLREKCGE